MISASVVVRLSAVLVLAAGSCSSPGGESDVVRIAFIQDLSAPDAEEHVQPALEAAELAVAMNQPSGRAVELVDLDLAEEPSAVEEVAGDPTFVAAIVGPGASGATAAEAGIPTLSVSTAGPTPAEGAWLRFVAPMDAVADEVAALTAGTRTCVLSEDPAPDALAELLSERIEGPTGTSAPGEAAALVRSSGCRAVAWAGSPDAAVELADELPAGVQLVGGDRLLDRDFREDVGPAGDQALAVCACVDLSTATDPEVLRFIQDYQSEFGTAPGPYAVESWDATRLLLGLIEVGTARADLGSSVAALATVPGLGAGYRFVPDGELREPAAQAFELRAGRWVVPVRT